MLREGLADVGHHVEVVNVPLELDTAGRVRLAAQPWRVPVVALRLIVAWLRLLAQSRRVHSPDVVVVGYMGHFDVHLAKLRWPRAHLVVDYLVSLADTARDRSVDRWPLEVRALDLADGAAVRQADTVAVDTADQATQVSTKHRHKTVVVPVGAPAAWFEAGDASGAPSLAIGGGPLRVVFFGLFTPLQGAPTIGEAIGKLASRRDISWTMIGNGQQRRPTQEATGEADVTWHDWVESGELPGVVAAHDVCLGIFGTGPKARRVAPNKVFQGAAAGCAIVTSDTPAQRVVLGDAAVYVPPGDAGALAVAIERLADDRSATHALRGVAHEEAERSFRPATVVGALAARLETAHDDRMSDGASTTHPPLSPNAALRWGLVREHFEAIQPESVLELGTGLGAVASWLAARVHYVGVEPDATSRARAIARLPETARVLSDVGDLEEHETFDLACAFEVLEHIPDDRADLARWVEHVRPGGHVLVSVPADPERFGPADELAGHVRRYSSAALAILFEAVGLETVQIDHYGFLLGNALEMGRHVIARRWLAGEATPGEAAARTAGSARILQPPTWSGPAIWLTTAPFRLVQRWFPSRGPGLVGLARRPL